MTSTRFPLPTVLAAAALIPFAACIDGDGDSDSGDSDIGAYVAIPGVDYSFARPSPSSLHADGYQFAARYLSNESAKNLSKGEAQSLIAAGLDIVLVWEESPTNSLGGYNQGVADARTAAAQATADGAPAGAPIYFAIDFDAVSSQMGTLDAYFDGVASVIGRGRTGAYGGYGSISHLFDAGKITWGWQTYAWSYGNWDGRAQVRQTENGILNDTCDRDEAVAANFGQWGHGGDGTGGGGGTNSVVEYAFQANTTSLWTVGNAGNRDWSLGMMPGTSPAIVPLRGGGFEVAFQANTGSLWTVGTAGNRDWGLGMMKGSSPAIAALANGGYEVAFEANTTDLWTVGTAGNKDWKLGMYSGTSPAITGLSGGGFEVAFEANTTDLWTVGDGGDKAWSLGMMAGSSPAITALASNGFEVAFEANTTSLWTVSNAGAAKNWSLGMMKGTSPAIATLASGGFEVAFEANTTDLWTVGDGGDKDWKLGMMSGTSPTITAVPGGFEALFQANTGNLWMAGTLGTGDMKLGMAKGTNPGS